MVIIEKENLVLDTITKMVTPGKFEQMPVSYGLEICKKNDDGSKYTILTLEWVKDDIKVEVVANRLLNVDNDEFETFKSLYKAGYELVYAAN